MIVASGNWDQSKKNYDGCRGWGFCYDANSSMTHKIDDSKTNYTYDAENRMTAVSGAATATFVYDGDENCTMGVVGGVTTTCIDNYFESCQGRSVPFTHNPN